MLGMATLSSKGARESKFITCHCGREAARVPDTVRLPSLVHPEINDGPKKKGEDQLREAGVGSNLISYH